MEFVKSLLGGAGGAAFVAGLFSLVQWFLNRRATKKDRTANKEEQGRAATTKEIDELKSMMERLVIADQTIMYDRIKHLGKSYIAREYVTVEELEDLKKMHSVYHHELTGNGFLDDLMEKVKALELRAS